jgi:hypothetical protein
MEADSGSVCRSTSVGIEYQPVLPSSDARRSVSRTVHSFTWHILRPKKGPITFHFLGLAKLPNLED